MQYFINELEVLSFLEKKIKRCLIDRLLFAHQILTEIAENGVSNDSSSSLNFSEIKIQLVVYCNKLPVVTLDVYLLKCNIVFGLRNFAYFIYISDLIQDPGHFLKSSKAIE